MSVVGGNVDALPHMLAHYRKLKVDSIFLNLHLSRADDPVRDQVEATAARDGCGIASVTVGDWQNVQQELYLRQREQFPGDWFLLADQDELQMWPGEVSAILDDCERRGWDHVRGCMIDRLARDGGFPAVNPAAPIWDQSRKPDRRERRASADRRMRAGLSALGGGQENCTAGSDCAVSVHRFETTDVKLVDSEIELLAEGAGLPARQFASHS